MKETINFLNSRIKALEIENNRLKKLLEDDN